MLWHDDDGDAAGQAQQTQGPPFIIIWGTVGFVL